mgnify:CR=1 FL=1
MNLSRITGIILDYYMGLPFDELFEVAEEISEEVKERGRKKK